MKKYIKATYRAAIKALKTGEDKDIDAVDKIGFENLATAKDIMDALLDGSIVYAYIKQGKRLTVYTKSLRGDYVQESKFCNLDGEIVANCHIDAMTPEIIADGFPAHGAYIYYKGQ